VPVLALDKIIAHMSVHNIPLLATAPRLLPVAIVAVVLEAHTVLLAIVLEPGTPTLG
jgi:hypothetical protein